MPVLNKARLLLLVAILSAAAGAVVFKTPAVLFLLATLLAAPILAGLMGKWMSRGLRVSRQMPLVAMVGDELRARLTVTNHGAVPALLVRAQGRGAAEKIGGASWRRAKTSAPPLADENACFEAVGEAELVVPILMPGASFAGEIAWKLKRRGWYAWPGARAGTIDPIALSDPLSARSAPAEILVLPRPLALRRLSRGGASSGAQPLRRALTADAADVHGVRPYQPGEGGRRIHWGATARTGELHVIEWEEDTASDLTILLDTHAACVAGAPGEDSLEMAITAAASVAAFLLGQSQQTRIFWWADGASDDVATSPGTATNGGAARNGATTDGARLMRVESRHLAGLTPVLSALAKIAICRHPNATLAALSARVARELGEQNALLLSSDGADWKQALAPWQSEFRPGGAHGGAYSGARGLAFDAASFRDAPSARIVARAGIRVTATMRRVQTSDVRGEAPLPPRVRRVRRDDSLLDALEKNV